MLTNGCSLNFMALLNILALGNELMANQLSSPAIIMPHVGETNQVKSVRVVVIFGQITSTCCLSIINASVWAESSDSKTMVSIASLTGFLTYIIPPIPPMPPMPPIPPPPGAPPLSGRSTIIASDVVSRPDTDAASTSPVRVTLVGSMIPALNMSQ